MGLGSILSTAEKKGEPTYHKLWAPDDGAVGESQQTGTEGLCGGGPGLGIIFWRRLHVYGGRVRGSNRGLVLASATTLKRTKKLAYFSKIDNWGNWQMKCLLNYHQKETKIIASQSLAPSFIKYHLKHHCLKIRWRIQGDGNWGPLNKGK